MNTIYIRGGDAKEPGVRVLKAHLEGKGHRVVRSKQEDYDVVVCWGCSMRDPLVKRVPALNGDVNLYNKYQALVRFEKKGIPIPEFESNMNPRFVYELHPPRLGPWFGRRLSHERGKDIEIYGSWRDVWNNGHHDFYTLYFPHVEELRAWVYEDKVFAWYRKHYRNPSIDNYKNLEYRSEFMGEFMDYDVTKAAVSAVKTLEMNFGAVDILRDGRGNFRVLEVNSMPDISRMERISGIRLANIISDWAQAQR